MKISKFVFIIPIVYIALWVFVWFAGNGQPVKSSDAFGFLIHQDPVYWVLLGLAIITLIACVYESRANNPYFEEKFLPWLVMFILCVASVAAFAYTRYSAGHDVNMSYRFNAYMEAKNGTSAPADQPIKVDSAGEKATDSTQTPKDGPNQ